VVIIIIFIISVIMARSTRRALIAEAAVASNEAKSSFLSNMSHEIRTPINAVIGMNEMILRESDDEKIVGYAENVKAAGDTLLSIVNDILDFSKIEAGKLELTPAEYDLSSVLNDMVNMVKTRMDEKGLTFVTEFDRNLPCRLYGDDVRIRQIMANILTNAAKYTEKGTVTFRVGFTKADGLEDTIRLKVSVKDTGNGIRKEDMEKLFSKFERLDIGKTRTIEGSGLGMSITRSLLQMMGSDIEVESTLGSGSTFSFTLDQIVVSWAPIGEYDAESLNASRKKKFAERFRAPDAKVLVVDDNPLNIKVFINLLKHTEMQVDTAEGGVAALSLICKNTYDLILLDHMMPEKDGVEVLHEFRARTDHPNVDTPVICLTANAVAGAREEYLSEGFDDYLSKPVNADLLEEMILKYLPPEKIFTVEEKQEEEAPVPEKILSLKEAGIDVETGISNSGTVEDYLSLLKIFYITMKDKAGEIDGYYRQEDYKNYTILVHALKSSARIIGALDLGEEAQKLELAGKAGDIEVIRHYHDRFMGHYRGYGEALKDLFESEEDGSDKPQADPEQIKRALEDVLQAAGEMDCIALDSIFEEMSAYSMPAEQAELWKKLKEASDHFDYEGIEKLLG
jgi:CheY-like chemotaxis protein/nitrogen-specific signal transduction histidine kinase/HPt (histidine-containing phosphotransfer) domain-containing protein